MKKNKMMLLAAACSILLLGSCGTSKNVQGSGSTSASHQKENATKGSVSRQSETLKKLAFVQKVSDNQVYTRNIVGNMSFTLQAGDKDITVPGKLSMRKDEIIRIQLFIPIWVQRWAVWSLLPTMYLSSTVCTRNISRQIIPR